MQESLYGWSLLDVALALKANKTAVNLLKNKNLCVMPRADLTDPSLQADAAPHVIDDTAALLDLEIRPLRACIVAKDYKMMQRIWRRLLIWDQCHFYRLIEIFIARQDIKGINMLTSSINNFVTHFYEAPVL